MYREFSQGFNQLQLKKRAYKSDKNCDVQTDLRKKKFSFVSLCLGALSIGWEVHERLKPRE